MKTALVYYSYEGSTAIAAEALKAAFNADSFEIKTKDNKKRKGFAKYLWGGFQVMAKRKPEILPLSMDVEAYDLIILGTPVWAGSPSAPMQSFIAKTKISGKKVALFCCSLGENKEFFGLFRKLLPGNTIVGEIAFVKSAEKENADLKNQISEWVKKLGA